MSDGEIKTTEVHVLKARAVRQAMVEILAENRVEILRRTRAKLVALGIPMEDADVGDMG